MLQRQHATSFYFYLNGKSAISVKHCFYQGSLLKLSKAFSSGKACFYMVTIANLVEPTWGMTSWKWSFSLVGSAQTAGNQKGATHPLVAFRFDFHCTELLEMDGSVFTAALLFLNYISVG